MRRRSTVGGALEMFSLPLPLPLLTVQIIDFVALAMLALVRALLTGR